MVGLSQFKLQKANNIAKRVYMINEFCYQYQKNMKL